MSGAAGPGESGRGAPLSAGAGQDLRTSAVARPPGLSRRWKILLAFAAIYLIWGSTYIGIKIAIESMPPLMMAGIRYAIAGLALLAWQLWRGDERPQPIHWRSAIVIGALLLLGGNGAVSWGETRVPSGLASLFISTVPLWIALLMWLRPGGSRPTGRVLLGIAMGLAGIWLLVDPPGRNGGGHVDSFGATVLLAGALCWSFGSLLSRRAPLPRSPLLGIAMEMLCGGVLLVLAGLAIGEGPRLNLAAISTRSLIALIYLITFGSLVGFTCYVWLMRVSKPSKVATYAFVNPVVAVLLGWLFGGEALTMQILLPAVIIVGAVAVTTVSPAPER